MTLQFEIYMYKNCNFNRGILIEAYPCRESRVGTSKKGLERQVGKAKRKRENEKYEAKRMLSCETVRVGPYYWRDQTAVGVLTARKVERRTK